MRPAIKYDTTIMSPVVYSWYTTDGKLDSQYFTSAPTQRRYMDKWASKPTVPSRNGQYRWPTTYYCEWGRWSISDNGLAYRPESVPPGSRYRIIWSGPTGGNLGYLASTYKVPQSVIDPLLVRALNKLRNQKVNYGTMIAEANESAKLFENSATKIAKSVEDFRRKSPGDFLKAALNSGRNPTKVPNRWLELQYGWTPLMSDLYASINVLDSNPIRDKDWVTVNANRSYSELRQYKLIWNPGFAETLVDVSLSIDVKVKLCYKLANFYLASLSSLGLLNPAEIIWEKLPYSFVVDWFLPVGNWLSALGGDFGYSFQNGHLTRFVSGTESVSRFIPAPGFVQAFGGSVSGKSGYLYRTVYESSPWPGLPRFKSPVSPTHIANAMSLLTSAYTRRLLNRR